MLKGRLMCVWILATTLWLTGCAAVNHQRPMTGGTQPANEALLKAADNHAGLIALYKSRLVDGNEEEQRKARLALGQVYLDTNDPESTLFTIETAFHQPGFSESSLRSEFWLLKSRALLARGQLQDAMAAVNMAEQLGSDNPHILNQKGLVYAEQKDYPAARDAINKARNAMLDDLVVKNNLAMLDILENDYGSAITRLMPLYTSGQADERIKANLILALVRAGLYNEFKTVYTGAGSEQERTALFMALSHAKFTEELR